MVQLKLMGLTVLQAQLKAQHKFKLVSRKHYLMTNNKRKYNQFKINK